MFYWSLVPCFFFQVDINLNNDSEKNIVLNREDSRVSVDNVHLPLRKGKTFIYTTDCNTKR